MGISGGQKTKTTTTPIVPGWIKTPYQNYGTRVQAMFDNPYVQPLNNQEKSAFSFTGGQGTNTMRGLMSFNPGEIRTSNLSQYMNPFTDSVINNSLNDNERSRQMAINAGQADAIAASAFGGSRHGVADSLTNREFADSGNNMAANLRLQGYNNAQEMAQQDINNRLNGAQFRLGAANSLSGNQRADAALTGTLGEQQRMRLALANNNSPEYMAMMGALLQGMNGPMFTGQESTSKTSGGGGLGAILGGIGSLASGLGGLGGIFGGASAAGDAAGFVPGWASGGFR